ncbi:MAG: hypothetical protein CMM49_04195 [Rhodospirillaceae bacterium]|nr:hypothetical protein [Rhodospirillaceae bacterium]|tara:strand:+ start:16386 stop:17729 length:1344 start_codon:yes stop_codon:yes gene_type:complete
MEKKSLTANLVEGLNKEITSQDRYRASLHFLDWIGCAFIGSVSGTGKVFYDFSISSMKGNAAILNGELCPPEVASFVNGSLGNIFEMDDIHRTSILHPGPVIIPAALAAAQEYSSNSETFLNSIICGYEAMIRLGESIGKEHYKFFHNTATCGSFGSGIAVGKVLNLNDEQLINVLGNCGSVIGGLWQMRNEDVMTKQFHNANAARTGFTTAILAKNGLTGPKFILEGPQGVYAAIGKDGDPQKIISDNYPNWKIFDTSFKPWAACRHAHPVIDATLNLKKKISPADINNVKIKTYKDAIKFCDRVSPKNVIDAKFSLQHVFATTLIDGPPSISSFDEKNYKRGDIDSLRKKINLVVSQKIEESYPEHYGAELEIDLYSGDKLKVFQKDALGDPGNPITERDVIKKFITLMNAANIKSLRIDDIINCVLGLSNGGELGKLERLLVQK